MATGKVYYWIKLKENFMNGDEVDFLMGQKDGANYVVLYQLLCLKCINTNGLMAKQIGEILVPFDVEKIVRDCKFFSKDTVIIALELYKKLGMIYQHEDGILRIVNFQNLVGKETDYAAQKKEQRERIKQKEITAKIEEKSIKNCMDIDVDNDVDIVHTEIRDKRLEIRDKSLDIRERERDRDLDVEKKISVKKNNKKEKVKKEKESTLPIAQSLFPEYNFSNIIQEKIISWLAYKDERRDHYQEQGLRALMRRIENKAKEHGDSAVCEVIEESMANGYKGIIFDRLKEKQEKKGRLDWIDEL